MYASSQVTLLNLPLPFSPSLISGYFRRSSSYIAESPEFPLGHNIFLDFGKYGFGSSFVTTPFFTYANAAHLFTHISHSVAIFFVLPISSGLVDAAALASI